MEKPSSKVHIKRQPGRHPLSDLHIQFVISYTHSVINVVLLCVITVVPWKGRIALTRFSLRKLILLACIRLETSSKSNFCRENVDWQNSSRSVRIPHGKPMDLRLKCLRTHSKIYCASLIEILPRTPVGRLKHSHWNWKRKMQKT